MVGFFISLGVILLMAAVGLGFAWAEIRTLRREAAAKANGD
jgi:hypothetical protein